MYYTCVTNAIHLYYECKTNVVRAYYRLILKSFIDILSLK